MEPGKEDEQSPSDFPAPGRGHRRRTPPGPRGGGRRPRGSGIQRTFHLRGIKLLQDGVPLNQADGGGLALTGSGSAQTLRASAWTGREGAAGLYYLASTDGGATWSEPQRLSDTGAHATRPGVVAAGGRFMVFWTEARDDRPGALMADGKPLASAK